LDGLSGRWGGSRVSAIGIARRELGAAVKISPWWVGPDCRWPVLGWGKIGSNAAGPLVSDPLSSIRISNGFLGLVND
jgi:hypothetical protein